MPRRTGRKLALLLGVITLLMCTSPAWSQKKSAKAPLTEAQAISVQKQYFDAMIAGDGNAMAALSADDMVYVHLNGLVQTKQEFLTWVSKMHFGKFDLQDYKVHAYDNAFVLNGTVIDTRGLHLRMTTVWEQRPTGWQMVVLQYTGIPDPNTSAPAAAPKSN